MCARDKRLRQVIDHQGGLGSRAGSPGSRRRSTTSRSLGAPVEVGKGGDLTGVPGGGGERAWLSRSVFEAQRLSSLGAFLGCQELCPLPSGTWGFKTR